MPNSASNAPVSRQSLSRDERQLRNRMGSLSVCKPCNGYCCLPISQSVIFDYSRPLIGFLSDPAFRVKIYNDTLKKSGKIEPVNVRERARASINDFFGKHSLEESAKCRNFGGVSPKEHPYQFFGYALSRIEDEHGQKCSFHSPDAGCTLGVFRPWLCWRHTCENLKQEISGFTPYDFLLTNLIGQSSERFLSQIDVMLKFPNLRERRVVFCEDPTELKDEIISLSEKRSISYKQGLTVSSVSVSTAVKHLISFKSIPGTTIICAHTDTLSHFEQHFDTSRDTSSMTLTRFGQVYSLY